MFVQNNSKTRERHTFVYVIKVYINKSLINTEDHSNGHGDRGMYMLLHECGHKTSRPTLGGKYYNKSWMTRCIMTERFMWFDEKMKNK